MNARKNYAQEVSKVAEGLDFENKTYEIHMQTSMGDIHLTLWPDVAPSHCANLIGLAESGFYDDLIFHRVVPGFVIQGGCPEGSGMGGPGYTIDAEFNDRAHEPGVLSMARAQDPNSAGSQFFLCLENVPYLDNQYTAFGKTKDDASLSIVLETG